MNRIWRKYAPYWHIGTGLIAIMIAVILQIQNVLGYDGRISALEIFKTKEERQITRMDYNIQIIGRAVGVKPLTREEDE